MPYPGEKLVISYFFETTTTLYLSFNERLQSQEHVQELRFLEVFLVDISPSMFKVILISWSFAYTYKGDDTYTQILVEKET